MTASSARSPPGPARPASTYDERDERRRLAEGEIDVDDLQRLADELAEEVHERRLRRVARPRLPPPAMTPPAEGVDLDEGGAMLDTLAVAREMTAGGIDRDQAEAIANAMRKVAEQGDHVTSDQFKAGLAEVRAEIANLDTRLSAQIGDVRTEVANLDTRLSTQIAGVRTEVANLETRLIRWMVGTVLATATLTAAILRFLSGSAG